MRRLLIAALWLGIVATPASARTGGKLTVLWTGDVDHIDCGQTYYELGTFICNATQKARTAFSQATQDAGAGPRRRRSAGLGGRQDGDGPDQGRRAVLAAVSGPHRHLGRRQVRDRARILPQRRRRLRADLFSDLAGARNHAKAGRRISGITTPDAQTVVLHFRHAVAGMIVSGALAFGATAPVPRAYAAKYDRRSRSTYGAHQLATGPYMVKRYRRGKEIQLVRNPSWTGRWTSSRPTWTRSTTSRATTIWSRPRAASSAGSR